MTDEQPRNTKKWIDDAEEALNKATEALRAAWDGTREARMSTLEAAKDAVGQLGKAIDQGIEVARETWDPSRATTPAGDEPPAGEPADD